jgi:hypothetical protein
MSEGNSKMSEKSSGERSMRELVAAAAGPRLMGDTRETWLARAARRAMVSARQVKAIWYGEIIDPEHRTARKLREAAAKHEAKNLAGQFEGLACALNVKDADFYSADVAALVVAARALRGLDRPGDDGD